VTRLLTVLACLAVAWLGSALPAAAHADLVSSSPADGVRLGSEPARVVLVFSEEVTTGLGVVHVIGPHGQRVDAGPVAQDHGRAATLAVALRPQIGTGTYVITWRAVASDDGHATAGGLTFVVGTPSGTPVTAVSTTPMATTGALEVAIWLSFIGFALLAGFLAVRLVCVPAAVGVPTWPGVTGWLVLMGATILELLLYGPYAAGDGPGHVLDRGLIATTLSVRMGHALLVRASALVLVAVAGDWLLARHGAASRNARWWLAGLLAAVVVTLATTWSVTSHAADGSESAVALSVTTAHLAAMGVWAGGLVTVFVALRPLPPPPPTELTEPNRSDGSVAVAVAAPPLPDTVAVTRFSRLALGAVTVLVATGLFQAVRELGGFTALVGTGYGRWLIVKVCLVAGVLTVAARSRRIVRRGTGLTGFRRTVLLELAGLLVVLAVTTLLIGSAPPG